jgi:hypothetical protein
MKPEDKAKELYNFFDKETPLYPREIRLCAIKVCDEMIAEIFEHDKSFTTHRDAFWQSVKKHIENL